MEKKQTSGKSAEVRTATVGAVTISGQSHSAVGPFTVEITLDNDTFNYEISAGDDVKDWFAHWPSGNFSAIVAEVEPGGTTITITVSGIPDVGSARALEITIPGDVLEGGSPITVDPNPAAKYDITAAVKCECDFKNFANAVNDGDLKQNADLQDDVAVPSSRTYIPIARDWKNVGMYKGTFNGNNHKITVALEGAGSFLALFGTNDGTIENLTVDGSVKLDENATDADFIAAIVAYNGINGKIIRCISQAVVTAYDKTLPNNAHSIAGIAGFNGCDIFSPDSPYFRIDPPPVYQEGGLISKCRNEGAITGGFNKIGGIAGENAGDIDQCANTGKITCIKGTEVRGWPGVGGIDGRNGNNNDTTEKGHVTYCRDTGEIADDGMTGASKNAYGGITGWTDTYSIVKGCYAAGLITQQDEPATSGNVNPIIGMFDSAPLDTSGNFSLDTIFASSPTDPALSGTRKDSDYMKTQAFVNDLNSGSADNPYVLDGTEGENYPILSWEAEESKKGKGKK
jgi:hypothetical protein